jgi:hypothetical protein
MCSKPTNKQYKPRRPHTSTTKATDFITALRAKSGRSDNAPTITPAKLPTHKPKPKSNAKPDRKLDYIPPTLPLEP